MVKATKFFRKQADKAESHALQEPDEEASAKLHALAEAYRAQADILKQQDKTVKKGKDEQG